MKTYRIKVRLCRAVNHDKSRNECLYLFIINNISNAVLMNFVSKSILITLLVMFHFSVKYYVILLRDGDAAQKDYE